MVWGWISKWVLGGPKMWLYGLGVTAVAAAYLFIRKSGADAERLKQAQAGMKAASTISKNRTEAGGKSDDKLNKEVDRWTRK